MADISMGEFNNSLHGQKYNLDFLVELTAVDGDNLLLRRPHFTSHHVRVQAVKERNISNEITDCLKNMLLTSGSFFFLFKIYFLFRYAACHF